MCACAESGPAGQNLKSSASSVADARHTIAAHGCTAEVQNCQAARRVLPSSETPQIASTSNGDCYELLRANGHMGLGCDVRIVSGFKTRHHNSHRGCSHLLLGMALSYCASAMGIQSGGWSMRPHFHRTVGTGSVLSRDAGEGNREWVGAAQATSADQRARSMRLATTRVSWSQSTGDSSAFVLLHHAPTVCDFRRAPRSPRHSRSLPGASAAGRRTPLMPAQQHRELPFKTTVGSATPDASEDGRRQDSVMDPNSPASMQVTSEPRSTLWGNWTEQEVKVATLLWIEKFVIGMKLCPFAVEAMNGLRVSVSDSKNRDMALDKVDIEIKWIVGLDKGSPACTLMVYPPALFEMGAGGDTENTPLCTFEDDVKRDKNAIECKLDECEGFDGFMSLATDAREMAQGFNAAHGQDVDSETL